MNKLLVLIALFIASNSLSFAQVSVEGVDINNLDIQYCELVGYKKSLVGSKIVVVVDYGQEFKLFQSQLIKGPDGNAVVFNTMVDALNFMEKNGWEYLNNYVITSGNSLIYRYLLQRKEE
ncbi:MAG TPA: hypothetical protein DCE41_21140 [Cytophagales bacterium]|nr:hypothetical protein [Cytophagales bacterium]HAP65190.1 hypothetical protein [Cytophagales bacterium]